jgi:hypothetical protein
MSIETLTFELDQHTIQIVDDDLCIWTGDRNLDPDVVISLRDLRRIIKCKKLVAKQEAAE